MVWVLESGAPGNVYRAGFTNAVEAMGSRYTRPASGQKVLSMTSGQAAFNGAGLSFIDAFLLDARNRVTPQNGAHLNLTISPSLGVFRGNAMSPDGASALPFSGVIYQKGGVGAGFFLKNGQSGQVFVSPAP
jgi:hypothetical protein